MSEANSSLPHLLADDDEIRRYGGLLDSLGIGLEVFAADASIRHRNAIGNELCGDPGQNMGQIWCEMDGQRVARDNHPLTQVMQTSRPVFDRMLILIRSGRPRISVRVNALPVFSDKGRMDRILLILARQPEDRSEQFSIHDPLTGVFSQNHAIFLLDNEIHRARRYGTPFSLAVIAVDQQRAFYRSNGSALADELFASVGKLLGKSMREIDIAGRIGIAEFLIILPNVALKDAMIGLERLRLLVETQEFLPDAVKATISGGVTEYTGENSAPLIEQCRSLLENAKDSGGNRFCVDLGVI